MRKAVLFAIAIFMATASLASDINTVTVRGTVQDNVFDCSGFGCSLTHGCLLYVSTFGDDPFVVHLAHGVGDDCNAISVDDCVEITGQVGNFPALNPSVGPYQLEGDLWSSSSACGSP